MDETSILMRLQEERILMIDLTGKSVFVKTQEEYLSVLKMAKLQGFTWARGNHLNPIKIPFPNILNFYDDKNVTCRDFERHCMKRPNSLERKKLRQESLLSGIQI